MLKDNYKKTTAFLSEEDARNIDLYLMEHKRTSYKDGMRAATLGWSTVLFVLFLAIAIPISYFTMRQPIYPADCIQCMTAEELCVTPQKIPWHTPDGVRTDHYWWPDGTACTRWRGSDAFICELD